MSETVQPASEWKSRFDLPMAALSLPGLVLDPALAPEQTGLPMDAAMQLPAQYRFDLPYTDEINALAQLPKVPRNPQEVSPLPDQKPPEPEKPLTRETFREHWQRLAERANLAGADAVAAFAKQADTTVIQHLIEPFAWPVRPELKLEQYPGALILDDEIKLESEEALRGFGGNFTEEGDGAIKRLPEGAPQSNPYTIVAGSMLAHRRDDGAFRDQRGLWRAASQAGGRLIKTPVKLHEDAAFYELTSALATFDLHVSENQTWRIWFRDLPVQSGAFVRTVSAAAEDVNDPEALSRERNYLSGYEWRLDGARAGEAFALFNLHFYPLTLENVSVVGDEVTQVEIIGRLQLPLSENREMEEFSNAVRVTFALDQANQLRLSAVKLESPVGEWPLALQGSEQGEAPCLLWGKISLSDGSFVLDDLRLNFFLFDAEWLLNLEKLVLPHGQKEIRQTYTFTQTASLASLAPQQAELTVGFDPANLRHQVVLSLAVTLGDSTRPAFKANVEFPLLGENAGKALWKSARLFDDIEIITASAVADDLAILYTPNALQCKWQEYRLMPETNLQLLPGMHVQSTQAPGFATMTFEAEASENKIPKLHLKTSFIEALLFLQWGKFLQSAAIPEHSGREQVFGSSAGDLAFGYTAQWQGDKWDEAFLLNGYWEIKNLISWPQAMFYDEEKRQLTLPAARPSGDSPALDHVRHTIRVLFNQHELPGGLLVLSQGPVIFHLAPEKPWQFLAVVEHQLIEVYPDSNLSTFRLQNDRRWTALQEVRLLSPQIFKAFLAYQRESAVNTLDPVRGINWIGDANYGYLRGQLRTELELEDPELDKLPLGTLLVEASAPHWIKQTPLAVAGATPLQFLPSGNQAGILSNPQDYGPTDPQHPEWLLLAMPFLGRLQDRAHDGLDTEAPVADELSFLQMDAILHVHRSRARQPQNALPSRALAFCSWADETPLEIRITNFDTPFGRLWARLDPAALEENWFRLQNPLPEPQPERLQSVMAALPATPARLSRATALRRAFDSFRRYYPPQPSEPAPWPVSEDIEWRPNSLMTLQGESSLGVHHQPPYSWYITGMQIVMSGFAKGENFASLPRRYAAATVLPAQLKQGDAENKMPVSLAVSPYVGLEFRPAGDAMKLRLVSTELLCLETASGQLRPVASHFMEPQSAADDLFKLSRIWASETRRRLAPESNIAILRFREINENTNADRAAEAALTTTYSFAIVEDPQAPPKLAKRVFRMRSPVVQLRFREGQFGGKQMPQNIDTGEMEVRPFELAPPQVTGVQPIYLTGFNSKWPWGFSALRLSLQYTRGMQPAVGSLGRCTNRLLTLWWQAPQHFVQFRSALTSVLPAAGLPPKFRAAAIKSLLPVLPNPPLPLIRTRTDLASFDREAPFADTETNPATPEQREINCKVQLWQPVLPGALRYFILGGRPGVMFALRNQIVRQSNLLDNVFAFRTGDTLVSGSVPVQHRLPRPVPLPKNTDRRYALQTWASYFEPDKNLLVGAAPADEAFLAECGSEPNKQPARRLQLTLVDPPNAAVLPSWNGDLEFKIKLDMETPNPAGNEWEIELEAIDNDQKFSYGSPTVSPDGQYKFELLEGEPARLQGLLQSKRGGDVLLVQARASSKASAPGFFQTLSFPLRVLDDSVLPLPLEPWFVYFEDPEYNRRLASSSARAAANIKLEKKIDDRIEIILHAVTLAADRSEYNSDSRVALRYDWDDEAARGKTSLKLRRVDANKIVTELTLDAQNLDDLPAGQLMQFSLLELKHRDTAVRLQPGETLQFELIIEIEKTPPKPGDPLIKEKTSVFLPVGIVAEPVNPVPEAAYTLLRWQTIEGHRQVECVRFAWGPQPSRIELVCPDDLRSEVVRRRAVFQWRDAVRARTLEGYAIQKITATGSTHFPAPVPIV
jgi:hypothetical protein